jgi:O-antigen/teichoic acid export membrane protein
MAAVAVVRVIAGMGSAAVWIGGTVVGVIVVLVVFMGVVLVWALKAKTPAEQRYRLRLLREFLRFLRDVFRGRGQQ